MKKQKVIFIFIDRLRVKCWNYKDYMKIYSSYKSKDYKLLKGAPILICVEGTYIELTSLVKGVDKPYRSIVNKYVECILKDKPVENNIIWVIRR